MRLFYCLTATTSTVLLLAAIFEPTLVESATTDTATLSLLPVACYTQSGHDTLAAGGGGFDRLFCASPSSSSNGLCRAQWQVQFDWTLQRVTAFTLRFPDADASFTTSSSSSTGSGRCLDSFGAPLSVTARCQVIAFGGEDASQNTLTFQVDAIYHGGTTAVLAWQYRGAAVSCDTLATDPMSLDALLVTRQLSVTVAPLNTLLTLVEAAPTPLSALQLDCPLPAMPCVCRVGCAYARAFWLDNPTSVVWDRPAIADASTICGLSLEEWLSGHGVTNRFPLRVRDALAQLSVARMNLANYGCATPMLQDARAYEAYQHIWTRFTRETSAIDAVCHDNPPDDSLALFTSVLMQWNNGELYDGVNNTLSPCACVEFECAAQFGLNDDNLEPTDVGGTRPQQSNVGANGVTVVGIEFDHPREWDTLKLIFFIVACALAVVVAAMVCAALVCCVCWMGRGAGPSGFSYSSANRYMFSRIGTGVEDANGGGSHSLTLASTSASGDNVIIGSS